MIPDSLYASPVIGYRAENNGRNYSSEVRSGFRFRGQISSSSAGARHVIIHRFSTPLTFATWSKMPD